ncbi:MAG: D-2-hydroxyacid dehydrogenase [Treponema sp.]|jgi:phosphoglycerate dehydrogenase-like enzyme|nr:D-2-hydroxyacid dehydrogenase [Treponema sp.]
MDQYKGTILVTLQADRVPPDMEAQLKQAGDGRDVLIRTDTSGLEQELDTVEILMGFVPWDLIARMPHLRWVQLWSAGADGLQYYPALKERPFQLTSASGIHAQQLAEHTFGLLLAWNRRFPAVFAAQTQHDWRYVRAEETAVLAGKTMLILGYGVIGKRIAQIALAFGMQVIALRRSVPEALQEREKKEPLRIESIHALGSLLPAADVVVNILPYTEDTRHIIDAAALAAMKRTSLYVNVGRGATTDEPALIEALSSKRIAGALLDVTETEPLPEDSPLWDLDTVILTSHYAGLHPEYSALVMEIALDNLGRYIRGEPLRNLVDKHTGY